MKILVKGIRIIDPASPFHQQQKNILIRDGQIVSISEADQEADRVIDIPGLCASPGWLDVFAHFGDPGLEYLETAETGARAAAAGGYTDVMILPNTKPVLHGKSGIEYLVGKNSSLPVNLHPIGAITKNAEGKELAEMYDMHASGAVAFSDGTCTVQAAGLLLKALQYVKAIDKTIIQLPDDRSISATGLMNEGIVSTQLGLPGKPAIAEELMVRRDIELAQYTGSKLHITGVAAAGAIALIREARASGLPVTCSVTPYHLFFTDADLVQYDTNLKVNPPLRTAADRAALQAGVMDGTVDCIASHHLPFDNDHKMVEFEYAGFGMIGLETVFAVLRTAMPALSLERIVALLSTNPRKLFGLPQASIAEGNPAAISLFHPDAAWTPAGFQSRSANSPFKGVTLHGRPYGIIHKDTLFLSE